MMPDKHCTVEAGESFITRPFVSSVLGCVKQFYDDPENWKRFAEWHRQKYGCEPRPGYGKPMERKEAI